MECSGLRKELIDRYVGLDYDTQYKVLNIISEDKCLILSCPLQTKIDKEHF